MPWNIFTSHVHGIMYLLRHLGKEMVPNVLGSSLNKDLSEVERSHSPGGWENPNLELYFLKPQLVVDGEVPPLTAVAGAGNSALPQLGQHLPGMWGHRALRGRWTPGAQRPRQPPLLCTRHEEHHKCFTDKNMNHLVTFHLCLISPAEGWTVRATGATNFSSFTSGKQKSWISPSAQERQELKPDNEWKGWKAPAWDSGRPRTRELSALWAKASTKCLPLKTSTKLRFCSILQGL